MNPSLFSSKWLSIVMVGAIAVTFIGIQYFQNRHQSAAADQISLTSSHLVTSPLPSAPVPVNGQAVCVSGIQLDNRPANNQSLNQVTMKLTDKTTHAAQIVVSNATVSADGTIHFVVPGTQLSNSDTYLLQIKPIGYLEKTYPSVTKILSQCIASSQRFRFGDVNGDGKITKTDVNALVQLYQGNGSTMTKTVYQNQQPTLLDISHVISELNNK